jgi:hypothetical protein|tara:strand:+ start:2280 stop:2663 length:384 start_codon:yes stop_codon:yes gene_type:complete
MLNRVHELDTSLFSSIVSETTEADRQSLLALQSCLKARAGYVYMEIGSHLGGTIQPYYLDPSCAKIYSIDKRPLVQPDERGVEFHYPDNSSSRMLEGLAAAFPSSDHTRISAHTGWAATGYRIPTIK